MKKVFSKFLVCLVLSSFQNSFAQSQLEMNVNSMREFEKVDKDLNTVYKELLQIVNEKEKKLLIIAQNNWIKFRDSRCEFETKNYDGGSARTYMQSKCLIDCTEERIMNLKANLKDWGKKITHNR